MDQIHWAITASSGVGGLVFGLWWADRLSKLPSKHPETKRMIGLVGIPILAIFVGTYLARLAVETTAFAGVTPTTQTVEAKVTDIRTGRRFGGHYASFKVDSGSREIEAKMTWELYASLEPRRAPGRDCLLIQVETGRMGLRRTILPNLFDEPLGVEHYRRCTPAS